MSKGDVGQTVVGEVGGEQVREKEAGESVEMEAEQKAAPLKRFSGQLHAPMSVQFNTVYSEVFNRAF